MPVADHPIHPSTQKGADHRYGCWNKPRPVAGQVVKGAACYGGKEWPYVFTTECHHAATGDPVCQGCEHLPVARKKTRTDCVMEGIPPLTP